MTEQVTTKSRYFKTGQTINWGLHSVNEDRTGGSLLLKAGTETSLWGIGAGPARMSGKEQTGEKATPYRASITRIGVKIATQDQHKIFQFGSSVKFKKFVSMKDNYHRAIVTINPAINFDDDEFEIKIPIFGKLDINTGTIQVNQFTCFVSGNNAVYEVDLLGCLIDFELPSIKSV